MRIPSQFNQDSLYRRGRRRGDSLHTTRRLVRLGIGLLLIVVVMRQASRPALYKTFFGAQTAASQPAASQPAASQTAASQTTASGGTASTLQSTAMGGNPQLGGDSQFGEGDTAAYSPISVDDRDIANLLTHSLPPKEQREWVVVLSRWQTGREIDAVPPSIDTIRDLLATDPEIGVQTRLRWEVMLASLEESSLHETTPPTPPTAIDRPCSTALLASLDEAAAGRVVDGTVWRAADFDSFFRGLDEADQLSSAGVSIVGVLPLLQQPDVFRHQLIRVYGTVARAERVPAQQNPFGITEYWKLWLRPTSGADRPMVAIVPTVPEAIATVGDDAALPEGPPVTVLGRFLKRLAYESSQGADLAPVVVGRIAEVEIVVEENSPGETPASPLLWGIIIIACLIGFSLAAFTMWRTAVTSQHSRELRTSHRTEPDSFLQGLSDATTSGAINEATDDVEPNP